MGHWHLRCIERRSIQSSTEGSRCKTLDGRATLSSTEGSVQDARWASLRAERTPPSLLLRARGARRPWRSGCTRADCPSRWKTRVPADVRSGLGRSAVRCWAFTTRWTDAWTCVSRNVHVVTTCTLEVRDVSAANATMERAAASLGCRDTRRWTWAATKQGHAAHNRGRFPPCVGGGHGQWGAHGMRRQAVKGN